MYCKRVKCIAIEAAWLLKKLYCNTVLWAAGLYRNTNCIVSLGKAWVAIQHGQALGARSWALRHGAGRCDTARRAASAGGRWGAQAAGARKRCGARGRQAAGTRAWANEQAGVARAAGGRWVGAGAAGRGRLSTGRGRGAAGLGRGARGVRPRRGRGARGVRHGRAGWLRAGHSVHSSYFRSFLTRYCS